MRTRDVVTFIKNREDIRKRKEAGQPRESWTHDPILAKYRFCNVHREDDAVTKWIAQKWRTPYEDYPHIWLLMVFARLFNLPSTLEAVGASRVLMGKLPAVEGILKDLPRPIFNGAYIVSTNGVRMDKVEYLMSHVLTPLWRDRKALQLKNQTLAEYHTQLMEYAGLGSFLAAQVVADLKYIDPLRIAPDWFTWAAPGPGSRRGLNRVFNRSVDAPWAVPVWQEHLGVLRTHVCAAINTPLHAQDLQNVLCEFDKYERARLGEGTPKQLYREKV